MVNKNNERKLPKAVCDLVYLLACAVHSCKPDLRIVSEMDFEALYQFSKFHSLTSMTYMAIDYPDILALAEPSVITAWKEEKDRAIRKNMLFDAERKLILADLEAAGIWYMPMKGAILQKYYPKYGMRQMGDNDILYDKSRQKDLVKIMKKNGYDIEMVGKSNHDVFLKKPLYNFEMHTALFDANSKKFKEYYLDVKNRMIKDITNSYGYYFKNEDFYIYILAHEYKHYINSGTGLRALIDNYIFIHKNADALNWEYIEQETKKLSIDQFELKIRHLSDKLFDTVEVFPDLTDEERKMLLELSGSGTYGTLQKKVSRRLNKVQKKDGSPTVLDKLKYLRSRIIPDMEWLKANAPVCAKYRVLIPFFLIYRAFKGILFNRKVLMNEVKILFNNRKKE